MLKYADLTKSQKRFVDALVSEFPEIAKTGQVSRKELESIYWTLNEKRASGGEKVGFPNWLTAKNKVGRGVFGLPLPEAQAAKAKKSALEEKTKFEKIIEESGSDDYYDQEVEDMKTSFAQSNI